MPLVSTETIRQNPLAVGPEKVVRNEKGVPVLGPNGKPMPLTANGKAKTKGGKRKTLNKRKTRKTLHNSRRR